MKHAEITWQIRTPQTPQEWQDYYQLRWEILRQPWGQPFGSERDELELQSEHLMLVAPDGAIGAVGRLHQIDSVYAQIRYMAVSDLYQGQGLGSRLIQALEQKATELGNEIVILNARDSALGFYQKHGYRQFEVAPELFGIKHYKMQKRVRMAGTAAQHQLWCSELVNTWHNTIPVSQFMQLGITSFNGNELCCQAPLEPNINLHQTMFAGSIYTLATLTGWGLQYLQLRSEGLMGDQVLADAAIRYLKPVQVNPQGRSSFTGIDGELSNLRSGKKAIQTIQVDILSDGEIAAQFTGRYVILPRKVNGPQDKA
ncbi:bifunctional GNAT family N-acetyltransferase/hotdog fold thioesterase [Chromatiaceae bacterium AAb-1]|nr:bifunctional GNAT family N-acetyltransferase/hotdog fold thioesterase [Chromatiaceae bacterium AAb-1]